MSLKPKKAPSSHPNVKADEPRTGPVERDAGARSSKNLVSAFQGPLPPPSLLREYDNVVPGLASEIVRWTTSQTAHRQGMENRAIGIDEKLSTWYVVEVLLGLVFGLVIALSVVAAVIYLAVQGKEIAAGALGTVGFGSMVAAFIGGRRKRSPSEAESSPKGSRKK